jgi:hypothetical protein
MPLFVLTFLAAIASIYNTLPSNVSRAYVTWAMNHPVGARSACQSDWDGIDPTLNEYYAFEAVCNIVNSPSLTPTEQAIIIGDLPNDCYPPLPGGACGGGAGTPGARTPLKQSNKSLHISRRNGSN